MQFILNILWRTLLWLRGGTLKLLILAGVLLLIWGISSPVGTLVWWFSQEAERLGVTTELPTRSPPHLNPESITPSTTATNVSCYIIFLPGVGDFSANQLTPGEEFFLDRLVQLHPDCVTVSDVFPYSAANQSLGANQRLLAPFWDAIESAEGWLESFGVLIKIRNLWRFAISADDRYGVVYNQGIATAILERMHATHPISPNAPQPLRVILLGTSGGVQVSLGAARYLKQWLDPQLIVVSVGGVFDGNTGFDQVERVYHLQGKRDWVEDIGRIIFASRWHWVAGSPFNRARQQGRYSVLVTGPHTHDGEEGYFGLNWVNESQTTYVELTVAQVDQLPIWAIPAHP
ncbi:hypothetical protein H6G89_00390 [Oscillatoria sp. FACHB-1407]|uniref:hypothetical protein n=1 Tax=Oscillatoria sp. FACHB-1407 TaxID=2692847 RepID=UPI0016839E0F|nr:hypothetical protein [Oscillatoria sp. FACHB-1407]MBD2459490.1 hypothetical protein [Oscillatoria sp. FACHB-1407]